MTYSTTRRIQRKRDLDRKQWAAIDKIAFDTLVEGTGEGQATIYFGEAFEKIPHFTWSAIASTETAYPTAEAWGYPHKDNGGLGPLDFTPSVTLSAWTGTFSGDQDVEGITGADGQFAVRFTPTAGNCEGIRLTVRNIGSPTDNLQVKLYEGTLDTATPGTLLASSTVLNADLPTTWTTVDFLFATPPTLTAAVHSFVVSRTGSRDASNYWGVRTTPTTSPAGTEKMVDTDDTWSGSWVANNVWYEAYQNYNQYPTDAFTQWGFMLDGGFEVMGMFEDTYIPTWLETGYNGIYPGVTTDEPYQRIAKNNESLFYPWTPYAGNQWVQGTRTNVRWELSQEKVLTYDREKSERRQGTWAAKYVFDDNPTSRYLVSAAGINHIEALSSVFYGWSDTEVTPHNWNIHEWDVVSYFLGAGRTYARFPFGQLYQPAGNPDSTTIRHRINVWTDAPLTCEMEVYLLNADGAWEDDPRYFLTKWDEKKVTFEINPDGWNQLDMDWQYPQELAFPARWLGYDLDSTEPSLNGRFFYAMWRFRFTTGVPGQVVYVDDCANYPLVKTFDNLPFITIGVESWIQDDREMYIGANLWFKTLSPNQGQGSGYLSRAAP
jgi:hypothetical protein